MYICKNAHKFFWLGTCVCWGFLFVYFGFCFASVLFLIKNWSQACLLLLVLFVLLLCFPSDPSVMVVPPYCKWGTWARGFNSSNTSARGWWTVRYRDSLLKKWKKKRTCYTENIVSFTFCFKFNSFVNWALLWKPQEWEIAVAIARGAYNEIRGFRNVDNHPIFSCISKTFISWLIANVFCSPT